MILPFSAGITGYCAEKGDTLSLELRSLRNLRTATFVTGDQTVINTIKAGFSPILEDYLGDNLPGFGDTFWAMMEYPIPVDGEERTFEIAKGVKMIFCWIPAGKAMLGESGTKKEHEFESNGFWMGKYEVTQAQWEAIMGKNPSEFKGANLPVETVNWEDCQEFIKKCSVSGLKVQLPHEDQWEYACRGGKGNKQAFYWGNTLNGDKANCDGEYPYGTDKKGAFLGRTTEVGSYEKVAPHLWNLCDMHGNVWEWCENSHTKEGWDRVFRGGSWGHFSLYCLAACRSWFSRTSVSNDLGLRLAVT